MRVIARSRLREYWKNYPDAEKPLKAWLLDIRLADWKSPADIVRRYATASILPNNRVVFNIRGNTYRLITAIRYDTKIVYIRFFGTHEDYDGVDATSI